MKLSNVVKHFATITKHKWIVFKFCLRIGIPWRGLVHDLSKYSFTEFWESAKYYQGNVSPITACKKENGYSKAWLHHKGRNKHHPEYWFDMNTKEKCPIIPYPYVAEMICDNLAAGIVYNGKNWTKQIQLNYWLHSKDKTMINEKVADLLTEVFTQVSEKGIDKTLTKKNIKNLYHEFCEEGRGTK